MIDFKSYSHRIRIDAPAKPAPVIKAEPETDEENDLLIVDSSKKKKSKTQDEVQPTIENIVFREVADIPPGAKVFIEIEIPVEQYRVLRDLDFRGKNNPVNFWHVR